MGQDGGDAARVKGLAEDDIDAALDAALPLLKQRLKERVRKLREAPAVDGAALNERFAADSDGFTFEFGGMDKYHAGLEGHIGNPNPNVREAMEEEHCRSPYAESDFVRPNKKTSSAKKEWDIGVFGEARVDREGAERAGWWSDDLGRRPNAREANLQIGRAHV